MERKIRIAAYVAGSILAISGAIIGTAYMWSCGKAAFEQSVPILDLLEVCMPGIAVRYGVCGIGIVILCILLRTRRSRS